MIIKTRHIRLATKNRLHVNAREIAVGLLLLRTALVVKGLERKEITMVGHGQGRHPELTRLLHERHKLTLTIQQGIGRVQVKMYELAH